MPAISRCFRSALLLAVSFGSTIDARATPEDDYANTIFPTLDWSEPLVLERLFDESGIYEPHRVSFSGTAIAADESGNWIAAWGVRHLQSGAAAQGQERDAIYFVRSADNGVSWSETDVLWMAEELEYSSSELQIINLAEGRFLASWTSTEPADLGVLPGRTTRYRITADGGQSWSEAQLLNNLARVDEGDDDQLKLRRAKNGELFAVWSSSRRLSGLLQPGRRIFHQHSKDGGESWTEPEYVSPILQMGGDQHSPDIFPSDEGNIYIVWTNGIEGQSVRPAINTQISIATSNDNGRTWNSPYPLLPDIARRTWFMGASMFLDTGNESPGVFWQGFTPAGTGVDFDEDGMPFSVEMPAYRLNAFSQLGEPMQNAETTQLWETWERRDYQIVTTPNGQHVSLFSKKTTGSPLNTAETFRLSDTLGEGRSLLLSVLDSGMSEYLGNQRLTHSPSRSAFFGDSASMAIGAEHAHVVIHHNGVRSEMLLKVARPRPLSEPFAVRMRVLELDAKPYPEIAVRIESEYFLPELSSEMLEVENGRILSIEALYDQRYTVVIEPVSLGPGHVVVRIPDGSLTALSGHRNAAPDPLVVPFEAENRSPTFSCRTETGIDCNEAVLDIGGLFHLQIGCLEQVRAVDLAQVEIANATLMGSEVLEGGCVEMTLRVAVPGKVEIVVPRGAATMRNGALSDEDAQYQFDPRLDESSRPTGRWSMPFELHGDAVASRNAGKSVLSYGAATGPGDEMLVTWYRGQGLMWSRSGDKGLNWSEPKVLADTPNPRAAPVVHIDGEGVWRVIEPAGVPGGSSNNFVLHTSDDAGETWSDPHEIVIIRELPSSGKDRAQLTQLPGGRLLLIWQAHRSGARALVRAHSDDGGRNWSAGREIFTTNTGWSDVLQPHTITVDSQGLVFVSWSAKQNYTGESDGHFYGYFTLSRDGGETWLAPRGAPMVPNQGDIHDIEWFRMEAGSNGRLIATWLGRTNRFAPPRPNGHLYFSRSDNEGLLWTSPIALKELLDADPGRYVPRGLKSDGRGSWRVAWTQSIPGSSSDEIVFLESSDNGETWGQNSYLLKTSEPRIGTIQGDMHLFPLSGDSWASIWRASSSTTGHRSNSFLIGTVSPAVDLARPTVTLRNLGPATTPDSVQKIEMAFSHPVWGLSTTDFEVTNGRVLTVSNRAYRATFNVEATNSGPVSIVLPENSVERVGGIGNVVSNELAWFYESDMPSVRINDNRPNLWSLRTLDLGIEFSAGVKGFEASDVVVENGRIVAFSGGERFYKLIVEAERPEDKTVVWVPGGVARTIGNAMPNLASEPFEQTNRERRINLTIGEMQRIGERNHYILTTHYSDFWFQEPRNDNFEIENGILAEMPAVEWNVGNEVKRFLLTPIEHGPVRVRGVAIESLIKEPFFAAFDPEELVIDYQPEEEEEGPGPGVYLSSNAAMVVHGAFGVDVQFDGPVVGLQREDFLVHNGHVTGLRGVGRRYQATISPEAPGMVRVAVAEGAARTVTGARSLASRNTLARIFDDGPPLAVTITPGWTGPSSEERIDFNISFNRPVTGFVADRGLRVCHSGTSHEGITLSGGPQDYVATVSGLSGEGSFRLEIPRKGGVRDARGIPLTADVQSPEVLLDTIAPTARLAAAPEWIDGELRLVLEASEALLTAPELSVAGGALKRVPETTPLGGARYAFQLRPETENDLHLHFLLVDLAGNVGVHEETDLVTVQDASGTPLPLRWPWAYGVALGMAMVWALGRRRKDGSSAM